MPRRATPSPEQEQPEAPRLRRERKKAPDAASVSRIQHETFNEQVLLAAAIVDPATRARLAKGLPADGFFGKGHGAAWMALVELDRQGLQYDPATLKQINPEVDTTYLDLLASQRPEVPPNLAFHVEAFLWDRRRIETARGPLAALVEALQDPASDQEKIRTLARTIGKSFDGSSSLRYLRDGEQVHAEAMRRVRKRREGEAIFPFGILALDYNDDGSRRMLTGAAPGKMTLIVGLSGGGKTTITNQIVLAQVNAGRKVLHGAWEEDAEDNLEILAAFSLKLDRTRLRTGDITDDEEDALSEEMDRLRQYVRFFELPYMRKKDKRTYNDEMLDVVEQHIEGAAVDVCVFDLWRRVLTQTDPGEEEQALWRQLAIAKSSRTHHIVVHHLLAKDVEKREDKRPTREAIKGTGAWIDVFDTILGVHRPALWKPVPDDKIEVHGLKQRKGRWPFTVEFDYDDRTGIISGGKEIPYEQPGERRAGGHDDFLDGGPAPERENPKRGRGRR